MFQSDEKICIFIAHTHFSVSKLGSQSTPKVQTIVLLLLICLHRTLWDLFRVARWPSGRASDSGARGPGFDPHSGRHVVSLSKIHKLTSQKSTGNTQEAVAPSRHE